MGIEDAVTVIQETQTVTEVTDEMDLEKEANFDIFEFLANSPFASFFGTSNDEEDDSTE